MLAKQRQNQILEFLHQKGSATTQELADALGVSAMTVHRDLSKLSEAGLLQKVHGGATLVANADVGANTPLAITENHTCSMCGKIISGRNTFILRKTNGEMLRACCGHCGLMLLLHTPDVSSAMVTDFLHGHVVGVKQAAYLLHSSLVVCCSPSIICFANQQEAINFQKGFSGNLADFETARQFLEHSM
ncbi:MAG: DeoR/GlpR family DNA-binding transcription regulator [Anaerolineales bacterium]